jgi:dephospho-CoA kinase
MKYLIGLTGLIGSGKSVVATCFAKLGIDIIDTDAIAHAITGINGDAIHTIKSVFGQKYITTTNALNRELIRDLIFQDFEAKQQLEAILHPLIFSKTQELIAISSSPYTIIVVPLLFKSLKYMSLIQHSILVDCPTELLIKRVIARSNLTISQINSILSYQSPRDLQLSLCDDVLNNNTGVAELYNNVLKLDIKYKNLCTNIL